jgi:general secretion pathway protein K
MDRSPTERERGTALVAVLWALVFLSILALSLVLATRTESRIGRNFAEQAQAKALADAGVYRALATLVDVDRTRRWRGDGRVYSFDLGEGQVRVSLQDEAGKVDLNAASAALLEAVFLSAGAEPTEAQALAAAVEDWRDADDLRRPHGAEEAEYQGAGKSYGPANRRFESIEDLNLVLGMSARLYERVAEHVTVFSGQSAIDPETAPAAVLAMIPGLGADAATAILQARAHRDGAAAASGALSSRFFGRGAGTVFTIHSEARSSGGAVYARAAVIRLTGDRQTPYFVLRWKQGLRRLFDVPD